MLFFVRLWYRLTMAWTKWRNPTAPVEAVGHILEIPTRILQGDLYRNDPRWTDYLAHPRCFQARINKGQHTYDCEDHAAYWATVLHKSRLVTKVGFGFIYWRDAAGQRNGHAICVFEDLNGQRFWADYGRPRPIADLAAWWDFGHDILSLYKGKSLRKIAYLEITGFTPGDTPIFRGEHLVRRKDFGPG